MYSRIFFAVGASVLLVFSLAESQIPRTLSYQGVLTDSLGVPKPDGTYSFTFRLYDTPSGMTALWSEQKTLQVKHGLFSTILGDQVPLDPSLTFDRQYWLGIQLGAGSEMVPRIQLTSSGYSFSSLKSDTARFAMSAPGQAYVDSARVAGTVSAAANLHISGLTIGVPGDGTRALRFLSGPNAFLDVTPTGPSPFNTVLGTVNNRNIILDPGTGNLGINTLTPAAKLDIAGDGGSWTTSGWNKQLQLTNGSAIKWTSNSSNWRHGIGQSNGGLYFGRATTDGVVGDMVYDMFIGDDGRVGVGTTTSSGNMLDVASVFGNTGNSAIRALYPAGGQLAGTEFGAVAHRDGFWSAVYAKGGTGGAFALYADGKTLVRRGTGGFALSTDATLQVQNLNTTGNSGWFWNASASNTDALLKLHIHPSSTGDFIDGWAWDGGPTLTRKFHITPAGTYVAGSDFAEEFEAAGGKSIYEPGDVVVLNDRSPKEVEKASIPYDTRVAGVYSTRPGVVGADKDGTTRIDENDIPIAIVGIVPTKVTDENGPIQTGDLLTTSSAPGRAMKASPVVMNGLKIYPTGTIIGKALGTLASGTGIIKVLVTLR